MAASLAAYRISFWGEPDPRWRKCTGIAAILGVLTLIVVYHDNYRPVFERRFAKGHP